MELESLQQLLLFQRYAILNYKVVSTLILRKSYLNILRDEEMKLKIPLGQERSKIQTSNLRIIDKG